MIKIKTLETTLDASVTVPASKSYTNRALILAAIADGESLIETPLKSDDTLFMAEALRLFGVDVVEGENNFKITGTGGKLKSPEKEIYVGNAGTAMRFLATFAVLSSHKTVLTGDERMKERPIEDLLKALRDLGFTARSINGNGCPPIEVQGGETISRQISLPGNLSSQYLTSLLLSLPILGKPITINIQGELTSAPYIDITLDILSDFGITIERVGDKSFHIDPNQRYLAKKYMVQGDASSASYFFAAAAVTGGKVTVRGINPATLQGDIKFLDMLEEMGCQIEKQNNSVTVTGKKLKGICIDMNRMPDVVQTAAITALFAEGNTRITNVANLRIKETDRISALSGELKKLGAGIKEGKDWIEIQPGQYQGATIDTYNDHRMAMSFAVAGLKIPGVSIKNPQCVNKSFPGFFNFWDTLYR